MDVPHVDAMDDPPVRTPARIGVLNQGAYPLLHPPPHADPDLEYPARVQSPTSATTGAPTGAACSCSVSEFPREDWAGAYGSCLGPALSAGATSPRPGLSG